ELALELGERGHERLGDEAAAELPEAAEPRRLGPGRRELDAGAPRRNLAHARSRSDTVVHPVVRRGGRVGNPRAARSVVLSAARRTDERAQLARVLVAGSRGGLHARRDVDTPRAHAADRLGDVAVVEAAGEEEP